MAASRRLAVKRARMTWRVRRSLAATFATNAEGFKEQYEQQSQQVEVLKTAMHQLESKVQEAQTKQDLLIARARAPKPKHRFGPRSVAWTSRARWAFARIEERSRARKRPPRRWASWIPIRPIIGSSCCSRRTTSIVNWRR
jgi:hypothetical protein